ELGLPSLSRSPVFLGHVPKDSEEAIHESALQFFRKCFAPGNRSKRPDALFVDDDIAMRAVALALIKLNIHVPSQMSIVCLANDAFDLHYGVPVVRYEFSTREIAAQMIQILWKRILSEPLPRLPVLIRGRIRERQGKAS